MLSTMIRGAAALAAVLMPTLAVAHSDIFVASQGGQVVLGAAADLDMEEGGPSFDLETKVFEAVFIKPAASTPPFFFTFERDEPGFFGSNASQVAGAAPLPGDADVSATLQSFSLGGATSDLYYWDGLGAVNFAPNTQPGVSFVIGGGSPFATTAPDGSLDDHPLFGLSGPAADGVYWMTLTAGVEGLTESAPINLVWLASSLIDDDDAAEEFEGLLEIFEGSGDPMDLGRFSSLAYFEEAVEFVDAHASVPEPSSVALALLCGCGLACRAASRA
ncbi:hypothetical protein Pla175_36460 [Pirellulimonas nuda]|uniref:PEP-CTERM protein-sorting domain-containing protein n=1 Tax=Pirellulimonas nuda TaxID=2528009 RepID=A0A518DFJ7_9BACT|nr:hypothetical protein [Pirellulimonas nuda]QDU90244.1 hypothetical protein Pla175_36460 [Pirellulimonas nuda]